MWGDSAVWGCVARAPPLERAAWGVHVGFVVRRRLGDRENRASLPCRAGHGEMGVRSKGPVPSWGQASRLHLLTAPKLGDWELWGGEEGAISSQGLAGRGRLGAQRMPVAPPRCPPSPHQEWEALGPPEAGAALWGQQRQLAPRHPYITTPTCPLGSPLPWFPGTAGPAGRRVPYTRAHTEGV